MPNKQRFGSELDVITILFHELGHWTGHKDRLNRSGVVQSWEFGSPEYAFEELVAELTACFLLSISIFPIAIRSHNTLPTSRDISRCSKAMQKH